jgi:hypothetical protein
MTVAALSPSIEYLENGSSPAFAVPFRFLAPQHLVATRIFADGTIDQLAYGTDYAATGGSTDAGGTLTVTAPAVAGTRLSIKRVTPRDQSMDYAVGDTFPAESHERALDRAMLVDQEQDVAIVDTALRALMVPVGEVAGVIPSAADRAGQFAAYDVLGRPVASPGTGNDPDLRGQLAQPDGGLLVGHADSAAGAVTRPLIEVLADAPLTEKAFGIALDGAYHAADASRWAALIAAGAAQKRPIQLTEGYGIIDATLAPAAGQVIRGAGKGRTQLEFRNPAGQLTMWGIALQTSMLVENFDVIVNKAGQTWCAAFGLDVDGMHGVTVSADVIGFDPGNYVGQYEAVAGEGKDLSDITFIGQRKRYLTFASLLRSNTNVAQFERINFLDQDIAWCHDGINMNGPGAFTATTNGTAILNTLNIPASHFKVGRKVYGPSLPVNGSVILDVGASSITLSDIPTGPNAAGVRFNSGHWIGGELRATVTKVEQFPVAFAGQRMFGQRGALTGFENDFAMIHGEDGWHGSRLRVVGWRNNLLPGVPSSAMAATGMIDLIGSCRDLGFDVDADLDQQTGGSPVVLCAQASAPQVSDNLIKPPTDISLGGTIRGGTGRIAFIAIEVPRFHLDNLTVISPGGGSVMRPIGSIPGTCLTGTLHVRNPGTIFEVNDNTNMSGLDRISYSGSMADFTAYCTGATTPRTSVIVARASVWEGIPLTADVTATWQSIGPALLDFGGGYDFKFRDNGAANGAVVAAHGASVINGALVPTDCTAYAGGSSDPVPGAGSPVQTDDHIRFSGGSPNRMEVRIYNGVTADGRADITLHGPLRARA